MALVFINSRISQCLATIILNSTTHVFIYYFWCEGSGCVGVDVGVCLKRLCTPMFFYSRDICSASVLSNCILKNIY